MQWFLLIWCFALGAAVGSFLNVVIYRLPLDKSLLYPASHCPQCFHPIPWYDNIPIVSYLVLRGRCRWCERSYSCRYMLIELWTALVFAGLWWYLAMHRGLHPGVFAAYALSMAVLTAATFTDLDRMVIPRGITYFGMAVGVIFSTAFPAMQRLPRRDLGPLFARFGIEGYDPSYFISYLKPYPHLDSLAASVAGLIGGYLLLWLVRTLGGLAFRKEVMGLADLDLMAFVGSVVGLRPVIAAFFLGVGVALVTMIAVAIWQRSVKGLRRPIPFGPSLAVGSAAVMLFWHLGIDRLVIMYEGQFRVVMGLMFGE